MKTLPLPFTILCLLFQLLPAPPQSNPWQANQTHCKPTAKHHRITFENPPYPPTDIFFLRIDLLPQTTHHEHYKSNTNFNILTFELFFWHSHATISFPQNPKLRSFKCYPHKKTHREKWKSIPDSCCHLHLLHLLCQDSFLSFLLKLLSFCFVSFSFRSFVFSTLFCFMCLCLTKPVKLSNSSLYASAMSIKC